MPVAGGGSTPRIPRPAPCHAARRSVSIGAMRYESTVTSLSWIPSEAVTGATRTAFDSGFTHYDDPPPAEFGSIEELRATDLFRFANVLQAWIDVDDSGRITGGGYGGSGLMGVTTLRLAGLSHTFQAVALPDIQRPPEKGGA